MNPVISSALPLVSIIVSTYNRAHFIKDSIQSIIDQTYSNWELIIVDDGSTDNTRDVVKQYNDDRIYYFYYDHSGSIGQLRNEGIKKAKGGLIAFQDSDDLWRSHKLEFQLNLLNEYPDASFVLSNGDQFGENAILTPDYESLFVGNLFLPVLHDSRFCFYGTSLIFKKEIIHEIGLLDESVPMMRELHFFYRMSHKFTGIFTNERLVVIRRHVHNTSNTYQVNAHMNSLQMLKEFYRDRALTKKQFQYLSSICYYKIGLFFLNKNDGSNAFKNFREHNSRRPLYFKGWIRLFQSVIKNLFYKTTTAT